MRRSLPRCPRAILCGLAVLVVELFLLSNIARVGPNAWIQTSM